MKIDHEAESAKNEGKRKAYFLLVLALSFVSIFVFNILTPFMSDDYSYGAQVSQAGSITALFAQEYNQYMTWTGRSVVHIILRLFLSQPVMVFKILNSAVFVLLTMLIYWNVRSDDREKYSSLRLILITLLVWLTGAAFPQTVLWEVGACNYLWGTTIILGFTTLYRYGIRRVSHGDLAGTAVGILLAVIAAVLGILAGWCNENTSGGGILLTIFMLLFWAYENKGEPRSRFLRPWMITGFLGQIIGFLFMVLAPGNISRSSMVSENHTGIYGMAARVQKITLILREEFFWLIAAFVVCLVICKVQEVEMKKLRSAFTFFIVSILTSYAMALAPSLQSRAFFGAGIFMIIALVQVIENVQDNEMIIIVCKRASVYVMLLYFFFVYVDCGAMNARIYRDCSERVEYIREQKAAGADEIVVPQVHKEFDNRYTEIFDSELKEDPGYWTNAQMESYFGVKSISAIPYDEWEKQYR